MGRPDDGQGGLTRKELLGAAAIAGAGALVGPAATAAARSARGASLAGMNVVLFLTDQERAIQHFPKHWVRHNLPGMSRLKSTGVTFRHAFTNACMCSPARSTLMTGYFPAQHGVKYTLEEDMPADQYPQVELPLDFRNMASVMSSLGYEAVYKGKWHLSKPKGADWAPSDVGQYGFSRWDPPDAGANQDVSEAGGGVTDNDGRYMYSMGTAEEGAEGVLGYLNSRAPHQQPFFMVISLVNPHDVLMYPRNFTEAGYHDSWLKGDIELPATVDEDLATKPTVQRQFRDLFSLTGPLPTPEMKRNYLNFYGNLMRSSDTYLVQVLDALSVAGLLDNTLVIRTSDHGEMGLAHGGMRQKNFNFYEESLRVPLVYSNPRLFPKPRTSNALVSHVDFLPTLASLFGAPQSARTDWQGRDYSRLVKHPNADAAQDYVVFTYDDYQSGQAQGPYPEPPNHIVAIRERRWKLAKYYDVDGNAPSQWEMYDLRRDPEEKTNLAAPGFKRTTAQEREFRRLKRKLKRVERNRLQPL